MPLHQNVKLLEDLAVRRRLLSPNAQRRPPSGRQCFRVVDVLGEFGGAHQGFVVRDRREDFAFFAEPLGGVAFGSLVFVHKRGFLEEALGFIGGGRRDEAGAVVVVGGGGGRGGHGALKQSHICALSLSLSPVRSTPSTTLRPTGSRLWGSAAVWSSRTSAIPRRCRRVLASRARRLRSGMYSSSAPSPARIAATRAAAGSSSSTRAMGGRTEGGTEGRRDGGRPAGGVET